MALLACSCLLVFCLFFVSLSACSFSCSLSCSCSWYHLLSFPGAGVVPVCHICALLLYLAVSASYISLLRCRKAAPSVLCVAGFGSCWHANRCCCVLFGQGSCILHWSRCSRPVFSFTHPGLSMSWGIYLPFPLPISLWSCFLVVCIFSMCIVFLFSALSMLPSVSSVVFGIFLPVAFRFLFCFLLLYRVLFCGVPYFLQGSLFYLICVPS